MRSAILRALAMSWVIESAVAPSSLDAVDDQIVDDVGHDRVEAGRRLVEEDDLGLGGDGAGEADALLHAAGQLGRHRARRPRAPSPTWPSFAIAPCLRLARGRPAGGLDEPEGDVLPDRQAVEQRAALEQHAELARSSSHACRARRRPPPRRRCGSSRCRACIRPRMHLSSTDLPVPEPPITTSDWPAGRSRSTPCSTCFGPKLLVRPRIAILGSRLAHRLKNSAVTT